MNEQVRVDTRGVTVPKRIVDPLDVLLDGHRVWSFNPERDGTVTAAGRTVAWHPALKPYLRGVARVVVRPHVGEEVLFDEEIGFGSSTDRVSVTDSAGYQLAVDKGGRMQRGFSDTDGDTKTLIVEAVQRVLHDLREECGLEAFLAFGCLLGAVRNGHMIGHDSDADLAYVSTRTHPFDIIRENHAAARRMKQLGWQVVRMSEADFKVWVDLADGRRCGIDVFGGYFVDDVFYLMPNVSGDHRPGRAGAGRADHPRGPRAARPGPPRGAARADVRRGLEGPGPLLQVHAAHQHRAAHQRVDARPADQPAALARLLQARGEPRLPSGPSDFAHWVGERIEPGSRVVDVGAGNGRDALWFAEQGHPVTALDAAVNGMRRLRVRAARKRLPVERRMVNFNEVRTPLVVAAELARLPEERHLHARFLLDALSGQARQAFWRFAAVTQRTGGRTFLEFRTSASRGEPRGTPPTSASTWTRTRWSPRSSSTAAPWSSARRVAASPSCARRTPTSAGSVVEWGGTRRPAPPRQEPADLREQIGALEREVQRIRGRHQRVHDVLELVTEVLVPVSDPADPRLVDALEHLRRLLPDTPDRP